MCGIIGQWNFKEKVGIEEFVRMRDILKHRGPDGSGLYVNKSNSVVLGHRRLSLIDLSENGTQPMCNEKKNIWLTANGEIYNYKEIRKVLIEKGHQFYSTSDSEVIIHGYEEWGNEVLGKLKGMFAFCIYDETKEIFMIARDRFGVKPCYYYNNNDVFLFSSELKSIVAYHNFKKDVDNTSICNYLTYRYVPSPATIWEKTYKLPPAHYLIIDKNQNIEIKEYWKLQANKEHYNKNFLIEKTNDFLKASVCEHLESDVLIGSFLSGGYDSSALVYYMNQQNYPTKTFSIGFDNWDQSEHQYAEIVSAKFNTEQQFEILDKSSLGAIDELSYYYDVPIADISTIPTFLVSRLASKTVKAVLSGEGSDEVFAGYNWHKNIRTKPFIEEILSYLKQESNYSISDYTNSMAMGLFDRENLKGIIGKDFQKYIPENPFWFYKQHYKPEIGNIKSYQYLDIKTFMGELVLTKIDRASMANSLEVRVPFLDHELVEFVFSLQETDYAKKNIQKFLLYENIKKSMPKEILKRKKQGFVGPDSYYMNYNWYKQQLANSKIAEAGIICKARLNELINNKEHWKLWKLAVLEKWFNKWVS